MPLTRKAFMQSGAAMVVAAPLMPTLYHAENLPFRAVRIANLRDLRIGQPITFQYPDSQTLAYLVKLGRIAIGGVGPRQDIVAFTGICTHMGCPVVFKEDRFVCPCHFSQFDPAKNGEVFQGLAVEYLPQIQLHVVAASGDIVAEAIEGVIWGRVSD